MSTAKLKLLDSALEKLADIAKNSGPLNDMFQSMKEGSLMMAPYNTFFELIGAATAKESVETVSDLFKLLSDPAVKDLIAELGAMFGAVFQVIGLGVVNMVKWGDQLETEIRRQVLAHEGFWGKFAEIQFALRTLWEALWRDVRPWVEQGRDYGRGEGMPTPPSGDTYQGGGGR